MASRKTAASSGKPASRSRSTTNASDASRGRSLAQPTMNSSAFGSRSRSRNGEGSMASNNCLNSPTCTSMTAHLAGIGSPADALSFERFVTALVRFYQDPKREAVARLVDSLDDLSEPHHHRHTNTYQVFENLYPASCLWLKTVGIGNIANKDFWKALCTCPGYDHVLVCSN